MATCFHNDLMHLGDVGTLDAAYLPFWDSMMPTSPFSTNSLGISSKILSDIQKHTCLTLGRKFSN